MKVFLGLFGCYRTFEKTSKNLFTNLIDNNPDCNFDIYINTESEQICEEHEWKTNNKNIINIPRMN